MSTRLASLVAVALLVLQAALPAQRLATATPESVGMSAERLGRLTRVMDEYTKGRQIAGTVTLVARAGRIVDHEASGLRDVELNAPMQRATLFRIASQTKR